MKTVNFLTLLIFVFMSGCYERTHSVYNISTICNDVKTFGAQGDGVTDDTAAIDKAVSAAATSGSVVCFPAGAYKLTSSIQMQAKVTLQGAGSAVTKLVWNTTGNGVQMISAVNSTTAVNTKVLDLSLVNTNAANVGAGYDDVGGTFVTLERVTIVGFKYGVVLDQTEIATLAELDIEGPLLAGVWLVNNDEHTPGASAGYTNRITIQDSQFNSNGSNTVGIIDDGGTSHTIVNNNFNGWTEHVRSAGGTAVSIRNNQMESASGVNIEMNFTTYAGNSGPGQDQSIEIDGNSVIPSVGKAALIFYSAGQATVSNNYFGYSTSAKITGTGNVFDMIVFGNTNAGGGSMLDGTPSNGATLGYQQ